ncbi:hypothetical protein [Actinopolymorpha singaporensis]|uniref:Uncharacterized protein n=1 Tax=Actinopolymorpha singaporensis TaxID=117157 RepID=A0A1H1RLM6_9ACTN|nr:hypothetical protein [Actinopolymorpha singaporensis]SDS36436.1 hypothetical protein SAMN04489717_2459 [Actinopolymorpha singaporensis]
MQAERWRPTGGRHAARRERPRGTGDDADRVAGNAGDTGRTAGETGRDAGDTARTVRWLRHPGTVDRVAAVMYESRTGRRWLSAAEVDRVGYLANARAVLEYLAAEVPV